MKNLNRRGFINSVAAGMVAVGASTVAGAAETNSSPIGNLGGDPAFDAWLSKIHGDHRQVFDAPSAHEGMPLAWARVFLMTNEQVGIPKGGSTSVLILRHDAIPIAMKSDLWEKYNFGEFFKIEDHISNLPAKRNPFHLPKAGELPLPGMSVEELLASGVLIGVCDLAMTFNSMRMGKKLNIDPAKLKSEWVSGLIPGVQRVPSGVLAVNRAQEHKCTYCFAG